MADAHAATLAPRPAHAHHFASLEQQREAAALGMWVFLVTEVMFFGGLFAAYAINRYRFPEAFAAASGHLDAKLGALNTAILMLSTLTMALAVRAAAGCSRKYLAAFLALTVLLGGGFLGIKSIEYGEKFAHHLVPGPGFAFAGPLKPQAELFFSLYFAMTGLHLVHMLVGLVILAVLLGMALRGRFTAESHAPVVMTGLYWDFVDIVWIFLFPLLYLVGRH